MLCVGIGFAALSLPGAQPDIRRGATVEAIDRVLPSVVNIATETVIEYHDWYDELLREYYGRPPRQARSISLGSGVIIDDEGYVLTNFHVVRRASRIQVKLWDGREYDADPIVATTASDVALLKLRCKPDEKFKAIQFAADDDLLLGETVLALGNPFGLGGSVTRGILSSKNRRPSTGNEPLNVEDWLQTDAAINPGNSGGPLVDLRGELIGLNVAVYREQGGERGMGVGFSIPVKQVSAALSKFFTPELRDSLWLGAQFRAGPAALEVRSVDPGSPAADAGLRQGDQVLSLNGAPPRGLIPFSRRLGADSGHKARLEVRRAEQTLVLNIQMVPFEDLIQHKLGVVLAEPTDKIARRLGLRTGDALVIEQVDKDGPVERAGLQRGSLVTAIDRQSAGDLRSVADVLARKKTGETVQLDVALPRMLGSSYVELRQGTVQIEVR